MIPINNSDLAWLVVSDYNQDHNIGFPDELREDIHDPDVNGWNHHFAPIGVGSTIDGMSTGGRVASSSILEDIDSIRNDDNYISYAGDHGGTNIGCLVGGHWWLL